MDKSIAESVKELIAGNKLEDALNLLISSLKESNDKKLNSLILLKGKLSLLKEQEIAGLLDFEDLTREKAKIAHSLLESISSGLPTIETSVTSISGKPSSPLFKYLLLGAGVLLVLVGVLVYTSDAIKSADLEEPTSNSESNHSLAQHNLPSQGSSKYHFTMGLPVEQPFDIADISYNIKSATLEKHADPVPPNPGKVKLVISAQLIGKRKGTGGVSWREERVRVLVDGVPYAPISQNVNGGWIPLDSNAQDLLEFAFDDNGHDYILEFSYEEQVHRFPFSFSKK